MEKEKLSSLREGMVGRRVVLLDEDTLEDESRSMYFPFIILLINIIALPILLPIMSDSTIMNDQLSIIVTSNTKSPFSYLQLSDIISLAY